MTCGTPVVGFTVEEMDDSPLVTVVTVTRNCAKLIQATIDSVTAQDYSHMEHIIVDGASSDGTLAIIRNNESKFARWISEPDGGIYEAMNKGLRLASPRSRFITFLNAGDVFHDAQVVQDVVSHGVGVNANIYGNVGKGGRLLTSPNRVNWFVLSTDMVCHQGVFFETKAHRKNFYDTSYELCADYKLLLDMTGAGRKFTKIERTIVDFDETGISSTRREALHQEKNQIRRSYPLVKFYRLMKLSSRGLRKVAMKSISL